MKKLLIIGSKGFIGTAATQYFRDKQAAYDVWGCDVVVEYNDAQYFCVDGTNADFEPIFQAQGFDYCLNCSGAASVPDSLLHPRRDFLLNTSNVFSILEAIRHHTPDCRFINLSSAAVYGNPTHLPITEDMPTAPVSPYGYHKRYAEDICKEYWHIFGIRSCQLRLFSAYGIGLKKQLFWDLYKKAESQSAIVLHGTGEESRDFISIEDILQTIECIMYRAAFEGESINVGNGEEIKIKEAVRLFFHYLDNTLTYDFSNNNRVGDPINWQADISQLKSLGYVQTVSIEVGIKKYVEWIKNGLK